jgi:hypothetical protein
MNQPLEHWVSEVSTDDVARAAGYPAPSRVA